MYLNATSLCPETTLQPPRLPTEPPYAGRAAHSAGRPLRLPAKPSFLRLKSLFLRLQILCYDRPSADQLLRSASGVRRTRRGKQHCFTAGALLDISAINIIGLSAVAVNPPYITLLQNDAEIVGTDTPDAGIRRTADFTFSDGIPQRQMMFENQRPFCLDSLWLRTVQYRRHHLPEAIPRVSVIEILFSGPNGGKRAQNQNPAVFIKQRIEGMLYSFSSGLRFSGHCFPHFPFRLILISVCSLSPRRT